MIISIISDDHHTLQLNMHTIIHLLTLLMAYAAMCYIHCRFKNTIFQDFSISLILKAPYGISVYALNITPMYTWMCIGIGSLMHRNIT